MGGVRALPALSMVATHMKTVQQLHAGKMTNYYGLVFYTFPES